MLPSDPFAPDHESVDQEFIRREVTSFVRRTNRMTPSQERAWQLHAPRIVVDVPEVTGTAMVPPRPPLDLEAVFGRQGELVVEIGPGAGETLLALAASRPETNFLAFEVYRSSVGAIVVKCAATGIDNIRVVLADAVTGLQHLLTPDAVSEFLTFFPDPWPKNRHHKRRLVDPQFADVVASRLAPGGLWRLATDWPNYADQMRTVLSAHPDFVNLYGEVGGWAPRWSTRPLTRFEQRGIDEGRPIRDLAVRRRERS